MMVSATLLEEPPTIRPCDAGPDRALPNRPSSAPTVSPGAWGPWGRPLRAQCIPWPSAEDRFVGCPPPPPKLPGELESSRHTPNGANEPQSAHHGSVSVAGAARRAAPVAALLVALTGIGALTNNSAQPLTVSSSWAEQVTPHLDALSLDIAKLGSPGLSPASAATADLALRADLRAASRVPLAPIPTWGKLWSAALGEAGAAQSTSPLTAAQRSAKLTYAADALVALGHDLSSRG